MENVAPTVLYLLGEPLPGDLEGRVLTEAIETSVLDTRPPTYDDDAPTEIASSGISAEDTEEVERRLRDLGYLE
jgi:hypothetical protein